MTQQKERVKYAHIRSEGPSWFHVDFRFDPLVQQAMKDAVGMGNYEWNSRKGKWYVRREFLTAVIDVFKTRDYKVYTNITVESDAYKEGEERGRRAERERRRQESRRAEQKKQAEEQVWDSFFGNDKRQAINPSKYTEIDLSWITIFKGVEKKQASKLFRQASIALHPDTGGNEEAFKSLNLGWQEYNE